MQFMMKLFEVAPQGNAAGLGTQKVAIKMPADGRFGSPDADSSFADIMAALFNMPSAQLEQSLSQLETIAVGEETKEWVPVIDLSKLVGNPAGLFPAADDQAMNKSDADSALADVVMDDLGMRAAADVIMDSAANSALSDVIMDNPSVSMMIDGLLNKGQSTGVDLSGLSALEAEAIGAGNDATQAAFKPIAAQLLTDLDADNPATAAPDIALQRDNTGKHPFSPGPGDNKQAWIESIPHQVKMPAEGILGKAAKAGEDMATQDPAGAAVSDDTQKNKNVRQAGKAETAGKNDSFAEMSFEAAKKSAPSLSQDKPDTEPKLSDVELKQRISPQEGRVGTDPTAAAPQGGSQSTTGAMPLDTLQANGTPSLEAMENKTAIHAGQEDAEVPTTHKEMETDVVRQIVQRMTLRSDGQQSHMQIRLKPEFLGNLRMDVITENRLVMVRMTAESQSVKEMIEQNIGLLKTELQHHGLQIQKIDVTVAQENNQWPSGQQQAAFDQARQRSDRRHGGRQHTKNGAQVSGGDVVQKTSAAVGAQRKISEVDFFA